MIKIKIKRHIKVLLISGLLLGFLLLCGMTPQIQELTQQLLEKTKIIRELRTDNQKLREQIVNLEIDKKEDRFIINTVDTLTKGVTVTAWANPSHIRYVKESCKRWEYVVADLKKTEKLACWQFVYCRLLATGLNANFRRQNLNGSFDNGIGDLNDCVLEEIQKDMDKDKNCPDWIKKGNWYNIDKSIYGLYIWINQRRRMRMPFADLKFYQWQMYSKIKDDNG